MFKMGHQHLNAAVRIEFIAYFPLPEGATLASFIHNQQP
jgi:hypothetical protein